MYDGRLLCQSDTEYAVNDTYANYVKATADQSAGTAMQTAGQIWNTATPAKAVSLDPVYYLTGEDIVVTGNANLTVGEVELYCYWYPISEDGAVVSAE